MAKVDMERVNEYLIPMNFIDESRFLNGIFKTRNFVEGSIMGGTVGIIFWALISAPFEAKLSLIIGIAFPFFMLGLSGINGDAFEQWAMAVPLSAVAHHRDDLFQVEAIFMGQAGLLQDEAISPRHRREAEADGYLMRLRSEYAYMARKFDLSPMDCKQWRFLRLRPQNFPHIRIAQMARLYHEGRTGLARLLDCADTQAIFDLYATAATPYWQTHFAFGEESRPGDKRLSAASLRLLVINTAIPVLFAYGRHTMDEGLCQRATELLDSLPPEANAVIRTWRECGLCAKTAGDSQALMQLRREYCDRRDCLRCRFGYEYLKRVKN